MRLVSLLLLPAVTASMTALAATAPAPAPAASRAFVAAWTQPADDAGPPAERGTLRQVVRVRATGERVRVRLSNRFGDKPLLLGPVHVALAALPRVAAPLRAGTDRALRFGGQDAVTIPPGESRLSDPVALPVAAGDLLAVSLFVPERTGASTVHGFGGRDIAIAPSMDVSASPLLPSDTKADDSTWFLTEVDVEAAAPARALVVLGDSVSDGVGSTKGADERWPDQLAARLRTLPALADVAVVNAGIAGNRILRDGSDPYVGPSALSRLDADALDLPGARAVIVLLGTNDISASDALPDPKQHASAEEIIEGLKQLATRVHARGLKVIGATLLPRVGATGQRGDTPAAAQKRRVVNAWIRRGGAFDAVVDFEAAVRDPEQPGRLLPSYDSGDHTHPNDFGYAAMAKAVDLKVLARLMALK